MIQKQSSKIVPNPGAWRSGETEERLAAAIPHETLPLRDVGVGSGVEPGGVRHTDVEMVPRVTLDEEARDVTHPGDVDAVRSPILVFGPAKIPCDAAHGKEMIPAVGSVPIRLLPDPLGHHLAMTVAISRGVVRP